MDTAIAQLVSDAVSADGVIDIYAELGVDKPDISILSDAFLDRLANDDRPNLQMQMLRRLLNDEIRTKRRTNVVEARKFSELLETAILKYTNRTLTTAEIIAELGPDDEVLIVRNETPLARLSAPQTPGGCEARRSW